MRGRQTHSVTGQRVNILGFAGHTVPAVIAQPCHPSRHRQHINDRMLLCSNGTLFMDTEIWHNAHILWNTILLIFYNHSKMYKTIWAHRLYKNRWWVQFGPGDHSLPTSGLGQWQSINWTWAESYDKAGVLIADSKGETATEQATNNAATEGRFNLLYELGRA